MNLQRLLDSFVPQVEELSPRPDIAYRFWGYLITAKRHGDLYHTFSTNCWRSSLGSQKTREEALRLIEKVLQDLNNPETSNVDSHPDKDRKGDQDDLSKYTSNLTSRALLGQKMQLWEGGGSETIQAAHKVELFKCQLCENYSTQKIILLVMASWFPLSAIFLELYQTTAQWNSGCNLSKTTIIGNNCF